MSAKTPDQNPPIPEDSPEEPAVAPEEEASEVTAARAVDEPADSAASVASATNVAGQDASAAFGAVAEGNEGNKWPAQDGSVADAALAEHSDEPAAQIDPGAPAESPAPALLHDEVTTPLLPGGQPPVPPAGEPSIPAAQAMTAESSTRPQQFSSGRTPPPAYPVHSRAVAAEGRRKKGHRHTWLLVLIVAIVAFAAGGGAGYLASTMVNSTHTTAASSKSGSVSGSSSASSSAVVAPGEALDPTVPSALSSSSPGVSTYCAGFATFSSANAQNLDELSFYELAIPAFQQMQTGSALFDAANAARLSTAIDVMQQAETILQSDPYSTQLPDNYDYAWDVINGQLSYGAAVCSAD